MKFLVGVLIEKDKKLVRLEELGRNGEPTGKYTDYDVYHGKSIKLFTDDKNRLILQSEEEKKTSNESPAK